MRNRLACATAVGPRDRNDDNGLAILANWLGCDVVVLGVCDGIGGSKNGRRAAAETASALSGVLAYLPPIAAGDAPDIGHGALESTVRNWFGPALNRLQEVGEAENLTGLSTTMAACLAIGSHLVVWWLGDSRVYRFRDGRLQQLTKDHSYVERELQLPEELALEHPDRNIVTRFVKPGVTWEPEIALSDWRDGDVLLAVSDGISASCRSWELEASIAYWLAADVPAAFLCDALIRYVESNQRDNATVALAIRGTPKPYSLASPTVEWSTFLTRPMREDLVRALNDFPVGDAEWAARPRPPWRLADSDNGQVILQPSTNDLAQSPGGGICLECGAEVSVNGRCANHDANGAYHGRYFEVLEPTGKRWFQPIKEGENELTIGRKGSGASLEIEDEFVSMSHVLLRIAGEILDVQDLASDNGAWLGVQRIEIPLARLARGVVLRVGKHHVVLRTVGN